MDTLEFIDMKTTDEELMEAILASAKSQCVWHGFVWDECTLRQKVRYIPTAIGLLTAKTVSHNGATLAPAWIDRDNAS
jgi:hypothetical protein